MGISIRWAPALLAFCCPRLIIQCWSPAAGAVLPPMEQSNSSNSNNNSHADGPVCWLTQINNTISLLSSQMYKFAYLTANFIFCLSMGEGGNDPLTLNSFLGPVDCWLVGHWHYDSSGVASPENSIPIPASFSTHFNWSVGSFGISSIGPRGRTQLAGDVCPLSRPPSPQGDFQCLPCAQFQTREHPFPSIQPSSPQSTFVCTLYKWNIHFY